MPSKKEKSATLTNTAAEKVGPILALLDELYPDAECSLEYTDPLQLMVSTILSAQCTDERVNMVTPELFRKYPSVEALAEASIEELEEAVRSTGFYRNKAKNIKAACGVLVERHGGKVPADLDALVELPGVGRKTANVILGNAYGIPGIVVDTHVARVSERLGLTRKKDPEKIEQDLMVLIPEERWVKFCHQLIQHGRKLCQARKPKSEICPLRPYCDHAQKSS
jgi:endonuclease III